MKTLVQLTILLAALWVPGQTWARPAQTQTESLVQAQEFIRSQDLDSALALLTRVEKSEDNWQTSFWLGTVYLLRGDVELAALELDYALTAEADRAEIWLQRGLVESERGEPAAALGYFKVALQVDPRYALAYLNAGLAYAQLEQFERAQSAYSVFLRLSAGQGSTAQVRRLRHSVMVHFAQLDPQQASSVDADNS